MKLSVVSFLSFEGLKGQPLVGLGILSGNRQFLKEIQLRFNLQPNLKNGQVAKTGSIVLRLVNQMVTRADIHQALLSQFSLLRDVSI